MRFVQTDGALVYLLETEPDRYFYVVEDTERQAIVTVSDRRVRRRGIERLSVRYGWRIVER